MKKFKKLDITITDIKAKTILSFVFVVSFLTVPAVGFLPLGTVGFDITKNILSPLCHANILHLACNLLCVWMMRPRYHIVEGVVLAFIASFLPEIIDMPIMGLSGVIFSIIGIKYGKYGMLKSLFQKTWVFFVVTAFLPNIACLYHLYCVALGYSYGLLLKHRKEVSYGI